MFPNPDTLTEKNAGSAKVIENVSTSSTSSHQTRGGQKNGRGKQPGKFSGPARTAPKNPPSNGLFTDDRKQPLHQKQHLGEQHSNVNTPKQFFLSDKTDEMERMKMDLEISKQELISSHQVEVESLRNRLHRVSIEDSGSSTERILRSRILELELENARLTTINSQLTLQLAESSRNVSALLSRNSEMESKVTGLQKQCSELDAAKSKLTAAEIKVEELSHMLSSAIEREKKEKEIAREPMLSIRDAKRVAFSALQKGRGLEKLIRVLDLYFNRTGIRKSQNRELLKYSFSKFWIRAHPNAEIILFTQHQVVAVKKMVAILVTRTYRALRSAFIRLKSFSRYQLGISYPPGTSKARDPRFQWQEHQSGHSQATRPLLHVVGQQNYQSAHRSTISGIGG